MLQQRPQPDWSDGPAQRELLKSLDEMGGAGAELADPEVFRMLEEIEHLTRERLNARELLEGDGQALDLTEPRLGERNESLQKALLDAFGEPPESPPRMMQGEAPGLAAGTLAPIAAPAAQTGSLPEPKAPDDGASAVQPATAAETGIVAAIEASVAAAGALPASAAPAADALAAEGPTAASGASAAPRKRRADPEDFLPPGFFDPRDRPRPRRWGRWVALGLLIAAMLLVAGFLIRKNHNASLGAQPAPLGDLSRPAR